MSEHATPQKRFRRKKYLIRLRPQLGVALQMVAVLCGVSVIFAIGVHFLTRREGLYELGFYEFREVLLKVIAVYLAVSAGIFAILAISLTHRFVGPGFVLTRAVNAIMKGDYSQRLTLRTRDYLKDLAESISLLRDRLVERQQVVADLERCLEENDISAAKELVTRLKDPKPAESAPNAEANEDAKVEAKEEPEPEAASAS